MENTTSTIIRCLIHITFQLLLLICPVVMKGQVINNPYEPDRYTFSNSWESSRFNYDLQTQIDKYNALSQTFGKLSFIGFMGGALAYYVIFFDFSKYHNIFWDLCKDFAKEIPLSLLSGVLVALPFKTLSLMWSNKASEIRLQIDTYSSYYLPDYNNSLGVALTMNLVF